MTAASNVAMSPPSLTESAIKGPVRAAAGQRSAVFDEAAVNAYERLSRQARRLTRSADEAQDLVQDAYLRALQSSHRFAWGTDLRGWMATILRNLASNRWRDRARSRVIVDGGWVERAGAELAAAGETAEQRLLRHAGDLELEAAFKTLSTMQQRAVWLRDVEEQPCAEVARRLDVPLGTALSHISRGRRRLYRALATRMSDERSARSRMAS